MLEVRSKMINILHLIFDTSFLGMSLSKFLDFSDPDFG